MVRTTAWWGTRLRGPARPGSPCNRRSEHVKDARADSRPPVATTPTMAALPIPGLTTRSTRRTATASSRNFEG